MTVDNDSKLDKQIEELTKERDILKLKREIASLKNAEQRDEYVKKVPAKFLPFLPVILIYLLPIAGLLVFVGATISVLADGDKDAFPFIFLGIIPTIPLLVRLHRRSND